MAYHNPLNSLPQEITLNILSRLSAECVLDCKLVCRGWRHLLHIHANTIYFAGLHLQRQYGHSRHETLRQQLQQHKPFEHYHYGSDSGTMSFVGFNRRVRALWYIDYHDEDKRFNYRVKKINIRLPADVYGVCSDNGLICLTVKTKYNGIRAPGDLFAASPNEPLYICNPITRELANLPRILIDEKESIEGVYIVNGFGYHPLTNEYKVVRIYYIGNPKRPSFKGQVEVYTLGSGSGWRSAGETNYYLRPNFGYVGGNTTLGVCVNGALHWLCNESEDIVAFDLADEKFHLLRTIRLDYNARRIFVMRRCLYLEYYNGRSLELWFLKKNNEEEEEESSSSQHYYKSWSWNKDITIPLGLVGVPSHSSEIEDKITKIYPEFSITKMSEILLTMNGHGVLRNSYQGTNTKQAMELMKRQMEFISGKEWNWYMNLSLSHINNFVSLEALGERNVKRFVSERCATTLQDSLDTDRPVSPADLRDSKRLRKSKDQVLRLELSSDL